MKLIFLLIPVVFLLSCSYDDDQEDQTKKEGIVADYFPDFPVYHFANIQLGQPVEDAKESLGTLNYSRKEPLDHHFEGPNDVEVIFPVEAETLHSFKIFLFAEEDLERSEELHRFFSVNATKKNRSKSFAVYEFDNEAQVFEVSQFDQPKFIRLNFKLKTSR
ncbi:MAG: hypothetical protein HUJ25_02535 [Crocinitomicaceae bacterium]|nr:hypothetical protein [Crocinitomicaceae bacterium]